MNTKCRLSLLLSLSVLTAAFGFAQDTSIHPASRPDQPRIVGVWRGECDGLPCATLTITDETGSLSGAILFYLHMRKTVNDPYTSTPGIPEPIFNATFDRQTLTFQVSHRRAHPPRTLSDPPVTFQLRLTGPDQAELTNKSEHSPGLSMKRSEH